MKRIIRVFLWIIAAVAVAFVSFAIYIRVAPDDARTWHVDPAEISKKGAQNDFIVSPTGDGAHMASPVFDMSPNELMNKFRQVALSRPRTTILGDKDGYATFIQRSGKMAYPDYISVRAVEVEGGSALHIYSRARYGLRDFGVNKQRILSWLDRL